MFILLQKACFSFIGYIIAILIFCVIYKTIFIKHNVKKNRIVGICFIILSIILDLYFLTFRNIYNFSSIFSKISIIIGVSFLKIYSKNLFLSKKIYIALSINICLILGMIYFRITYCFQVTSGVLCYMCYASRVNVYSLFTIVIDILFISTLFILSIIMYKPKQFLYICPHCGAYTTVLQENIKNTNSQCSFCKADRILLNEKPTIDKKEFENHIFNTYLKNYPQFDENLYLERISKEQRK